MDSTNETLLVQCSGTRLDVHFGLGRHLFLCDLGSPDASTSTSIVWGYQSPARRQAAFDALPHVQRLPHDVAGASSPLAHEVVSRISDGLCASARCDDEADVPADGPNLPVEAAVWDLAMLLFLDVGAKDGYIGEALSKWTCRHAQVLGAGLDGDCTQHFAGLLGALAAKRERWDKDQERLFWTLLQQVVAQGWRERADEVLTAHWVMRQPASALAPQEGRLQTLLQVVCGLLGKAPSFADARPGPWPTFQAFLDARSQWLQTAMRLLSDDFAAELGFEEGELSGAGPASGEVRRVIRVLTSVEDPAALTASCPAWPHLLTGLLVHVYPHIRVSPELLVVLEHCQAARPPAPAPHLALLDRLLRAAVARNAPLALRAAAESGLCSEWLLAHLAQVLARHPRYGASLRADNAARSLLEANAPQVDVRAPLLQRCHYDVPEFFMLQYVAATLSHASGWKAALLSLTGCPAGGANAARVVVTRLPSPSEADELAVLQLTQQCDRLGLHEEALQISRAHAMADWREGRHAKALQTLSASSVSGAWMTLAAHSLLQQVQVHLAAGGPALAAPLPALDALAALLSSKLDELGRDAKARPGCSPEFFGPPDELGDALGCVAAYGALCRACKGLVSCAESRGVLSKQRVPSIAAHDVRKWVRVLMRIAPPRFQLKLLYKLIPFMGGSGIDVLSKSELQDLLIKLESTVDHPSCGGAVVDGSSLPLEPAHIQDLRASLAQSIATHASMTSCT